MKKPTFKRFFAYLIDTIIISAIVTIFSSIDLINPYKEEYETAYKEYQEYTLSIDNPNELLNGEEVNDLTYDLTHFGMYTSIISLVVSFLYFSIFQYYNKGRTIGKALLNIQVVSTNSKKLKLSQVIIRSAIINSLLTSSAIILALLFLSKPMFLKANLIISYIDMGLILASIGMIIYREDGVGLHDLLAHTQVVDALYQKDKVKEAKFEEKKSKKED